MRRRIAVLTLLVTVLAALTTLTACPAAAASMGAWRAPTSGPVSRAFALGADPFAAGQHRGADFAAAPGSPVRAACSGRVAVAARIGSSGGVVTVACGRWRVSHLPLARIDTRAGTHVTAGDPIGTAAPSREHAGIHLGVREAGRRWGYVDPLRFIRGDRAPPPAGPRGPRARGRRARREAPRAPRPVPRPAPRGAPVGAHPSVPVAAHPSVPVAAHPSARPLAPWPAWAALAALLLAAAGGARLGGVSRRSRRVPRAARTRPLAAASGASSAARGPARDDLPP
jgi:hypothetical protein